MQLSKKKSFCRFSTASSKSRLNFKQFEKNDDPQSLCTSKFLDCEMRSYTTVWKVLFQKTLRQAFWKMIPNNVEICAAIPLLDLLMTVKEMELEKVFLSDI